MADSRRDIIEQLKNIKFTHDKTQVVNVLDGASVGLLEDILNQVKTNGNDSQQAKKMVKDQAMRQNGRESALAVQVQLDDKQLAKKISQLRDIKIDIQTGDSKDHIDTLKEELQGLINACHKGDKQAIKLVKSFDLKGVKGIKNATTIMKQLDKQSRSSGKSLRDYGKAMANAFRPKFGNKKEIIETFKGNKKAVQDATRSFQDFKASTKGIFDSIKNFDISKLKQLSKLDLAAGFLTAVQGADAFHKKISDVNQKIMDYHRASQTVMGANSDIMPGGAKQLDSVRRNFNLTRQQAVNFAKSLSAVRGTTYAIGDVTKAMQGMKKTLGEVDVTQLQKLTQVMKNIPKDQMDAFTSGSGNAGDITNAIMNMHASGQTQNVLQLGANGAFGQQFAQASGTHINQYQKKYINNRRTVTTFTQTAQNKMQQGATSNMLTGTLFSGMPFASGMAKHSNLLTMGMGILGLGGGKGGKAAADVAQGDVQQKQESEVGNKQQQKQQPKQQQQKQQKNNNFDKILKNIEKRIIDLPKKDFKVKSVAKINQINNVDNVKKVQDINSVNNVKEQFSRLKGVLSGKGDKPGQLKEGAVAKIQNTIQQTNKLTEKNGNVLSKALSDLSGRTQNADLNFGDLFAGKMPNFQKIKQQFSNFNLRDVQSSFQNLDLTALDDVKKLSDLKGLANFKNLLQARKTTAGKTAIRIANAGKRVANSVRSGTSLTTALSAEGGKLLKPVFGKMGEVFKGGVKSMGKVALKAGPGILAGVAIQANSQTAKKQRAQREDISKQMRIQKKQKVVSDDLKSDALALGATIASSFMGPVGAAAVAVGHVLLQGALTAADALDNNGGDWGKALQAGWKSSAGIVLEGVRKLGWDIQGDQGRFERQIDIAALSQNKYSVQGFKDIARINKRVNELKQINMQRNMYMLKQYSDFRGKLSAIEKATSQQQFIVNVNTQQMDNAYQIGMSNKDYSSSASVIAQSAREIYSVKNQKINDLRRNVMADSKLTDQQRTVQLLHLQQEQIKIRQQFINNLKKSLDCSKIPSIIQNGFKRQINDAVIETSTIGYGGDDQAMFDAIGNNIALAIKDFTSATSFNMKSIATISKANSKAMQDALHQYNTASSKADDRFRKAKENALQSETATGNLIGSNDGGDIKGEQMGAIAHMALTQKHIAALERSGLAQAGDIANLRSGSTLANAGNGELNDSYSQGAKQQAIKNLTNMFQSQLASGDRQGAQATYDILEGLHTAMKQRGAAGQNFTALVEAAKDKLITSGREGLMKKNGADYSEQFSAQGVQRKASTDKQFMKFLQGRGLAKNGVVDSSNQQMTRMAYQEYKVDAGIQSSLDSLAKDNDIFRKLVEKNGGDKEKAFAQFQQQLQTGNLGIDKVTVRDSNQAIQKAVNTGDTSALQKNKASVQTVFDAAYKKATQDKDKSAIWQGKKALERLNSGQKLDEKTKKQLIAKVEAANNLIVNLTGNLNANARAAVENVIALRKVKNSQLKPAELMAQVFKGQTDAYKKLNQSILALQNAVQKSASVQRALIKAQFEQSKIALTTWNGGNVGQDMFKAQQADLKASQEKVKAADLALKKLSENKGQFDKLAQEGGASFNDLDKLFSGNLEVKVDGDKTFKQALTQIGDIAKESMNAQSDQQQQEARKKITENQKKMIHVVQHSGLSQNQRQMRKNAIKAAANTARQMVGSKGTIQNVQLKLLTQRNQAMAESINKMKGFAQSLRNASEGLQGFHASSVSALSTARQKLAKKQMRGAGEAVYNLNVTSQALTTQYSDQREQQKTKIDQALKALSQAKNNYKANPNKENQEALKVAQANVNQARAGMIDIDLGQMQSRAQAFASAIDVISTQASLAADSLRIMQDAAQNVAGTTADWYRLQNQKLAVMQKQVSSIRAVVQSKDFEKLSVQDQMKYRNMLAQKQLAVAKEKIGAQRTVFEKQLGAIIGGYQQQGAFMGFSKAAVFGIGHGVNQAGMAVRGENVSGNGLSARLLQKNGRTAFRNQGNSTFADVKSAVNNMGTPRGVEQTKQISVELKNAKAKQQQEQDTLKRMQQTGAYSQGEIQAQKKKIQQANAQVQRVEGRVGVKTDKKQQKKAVMQSLLQVTKNILAAITGGNVKFVFTQSGVGANNKGGQNTGNGANSSGQPSNGKNGNSGGDKPQNTAAQDKRQNSGKGGGQTGSNGVAQQNKKEAAPGPKNAPDKGQPPQQSGVPTKPAQQQKKKPDFVVFGDEEKERLATLAARSQQAATKQVDLWKGQTGVEKNLRLFVAAKKDVQARQQSSKDGKIHGLSGHQQRRYQELKNMKSRTKQQQQQMEQLYYIQQVSAMSPQQRQEHEKRLRQQAAKLQDDRKKMQLRQKSTTVQAQFAKQQLQASKDQQKRHFEIITGQNKNTTKQQVQQALTYWNNLTQAQKKRSGISNTVADNFVRDAYQRYGDTLQYKTIDRNKIAKQHQGQIDQIVSAKLGGTKAGDQQVSKEYNDSYIQAKNYYKSIGFDLDKVDPKQKYEYVKRFVTDAATKQVVDKHAKDAPMQSTRASSVVSADKFNSQVAELVQRQGKKKNGVTSQDVVKHLRDKGFNPQSMSERDIKYHTAKLILTKRIQSAKKRLGSIDMSNPDNMKRVQRLNARIANASNQLSTLNQNYAQSHVSQQADATSRTNEAVQRYYDGFNKRNQSDYTLLDAQKKVVQQTDTDEQLAAISGLTVQQFKQMFGTAGSRTEKQQQAFQKLQSDIRDKKLTQALPSIMDDAKGRFASDEKAKAQRAALSGRIYVQREFDQIGENERRNYVDGALGKTKTRLAEAKRREDRALKRNAILQQVGKDKLAGEEQRLWAEYHNDDTSDQFDEKVASYWRRKNTNIDFMGSDDATKKRLRQLYVSQTAADNLVAKHNGGDSLSADVQTPDNVVGSGNVQKNSPTVVGKKAPTATQPPNSATASNVAAKTTPSTQNWNDPNLRNMYFQYGNVPPQALAAQQQQQQQQPPITNTVNSTGAFKVQRQTSTATTDSVSSGYYGDGTVKVVLQGLQQFINAILKKSLNSANNQSQKRGR